MRLAHVMIRVNNLEESIEFYTNILKMKILNKTDNKQYKYTLVFLGFGDINTHTAIELTYNWDKSSYQHGDAFGHLCLEVDDIYQTCEEIKTKGGKVTREPGPVKGGTSIIAFIADPSGYQIELIGTKTR